MKLASILYIYLLAVFLVLGNLPRILPLPTALGSANAGEVFVYISTLIYITILVSFDRLSSRTKFVFYFSFITLISFSIGIFKWGLNIIPASYAIRFILQLLSAAVAGNALSIIYGQNVEKLCMHWVRLYLIVSLLGLALLIAFPDSVTLWAALGDVGVDFSGDPHVGRLVSLYFDPNFFASIIILPIIFTFVPLKNRVEMIFSFLLFLVCLALTASRSGISTFLFIGIYVSFSYFFKIRDSIKVSKIFIYQFAFFTLVSLAGYIIFSDYFTSLTERFSSVSSDDSASARLESFDIGNKLIEQQPLFGYGYNYVAEAIKIYRDLGLDSSIQSIIANYGIIFFVMMSLWVTVWFFNISKNVKRFGLNHRLNMAWKYAALYFVICMIWPANFNQLIFYPFWIIPIVAFFSYIEIMIYKLPIDHKEINVNNSDAVIRL